MEVGSSSSSLPLLLLCVTERSCGVKGSRWSWLQQINEGGMGDIMQEGLIDNEKLNLDGVSVE